ncbi:DUF1223 domain-containing protein [Sulfurirhabdus autotrophica]|uniref:DUF1223 domain-containing protein n=1 Tax=Sulfurirhabdus autotrophica TaxID=1706046 RepID=A0A4R3YEL7_9PROT|nr:DUF1223 domain-containing protein [Sulfurirhabdus autotrophica]TCV90607.1 hypothetical protein EDC63_101581 [Sulfurirhabdus autotrophica]
MNNAAFRLVSPVKSIHLRHIAVVALVWSVALVSSFASPLTQAATECSAFSGPTRVSLLELYTSEGCSSCPPADKWLSELVTQKSITQRVIPLALHVDYWDYIGWKDRFAQPLYSSRQREMARLSHSTLVYTPQVILNGKDFRGWGNDTFTRTVNEVSKLPPGAQITLTLNPAKADETHITAHAKARSGTALYVAVYQNDLFSEISAGENRGRKLYHDGVVREWIGPIVIGQGGQVSWQQAIRSKPEWVTTKMGVVAFVQDQATGEVLQAMQLPWCAG